MRRSGHLIRKFRQQQQPPLSLGKLAKRIGTSKGNLSRIENGLQDISDDLLPRVQAETAIPAAQLRPDLAKLFKAEAA